MTLPRLTLVLGGARSGKSALAERLALEDGRPIHYVATAVAFDDEMRDRIAHHRARRGARFVATIEAPIDLVGALTAVAAPDRVLLLDCLTVWLGNLLHEDRDAAAAGRDLATLLPTLPGSSILVSNEVGLGIVPENALARRFRDLQGRLNQQVAAVADRVLFVAAGLPLVMKG